MNKIGLFLSAESYVGGVTQYTHTLINAFSQIPDDENKKIIVYGSKKWESVLRNYSNIEMVYVKESGRRFSFHNIWRGIGLPMWLWRAVFGRFNRVVTVIEACKCDLWIFPATNAWGYMARVRSLVVIHDLMHRYERRFPEVSAGRIFKAREIHYKNICRYAAGIIVDSNVGKMQVLESYNFDENRISVLPYIAPPHLVVEHDSEDIRSKYRLPEKYIFYPATFWQHKNHVRLIQALDIVRHTNPDIRLVLTGAKKNSYQDAVNEISAHGLESNVMILGYVDDVDIQALYKSARALVMPTFFGPTNIPPLEAFALGCPVAISGIYGMYEQLGDAAIFFNPLSVNDIAESIKRLWEDDALCRSLIEKGKIHTNSSGVEKFNNQFREIIAKQCSFND